MDNYNEEFISDKELLERVQDYIKESIYKYAVMIDGNWGCGKTYFIKEKLINILKDKNLDKKFIYISLYGLATINDIKQAIYIETLSNFSKKKKKYIEYLKLFKPLLKTIDYISSIDGSFLVDNVIKQIQNNTTIKSSDMLVVVMDDLERCECPINEVLGYINSIIEHSKIKVIIVANEEEINKSSLFTNTELKYLVAMQNIDTNTFTQSSEKDDNFKTDAPLSLNTLKKQAEIIFDKKTDYELIREKVIGEVFHYSPNFKAAIINILENAKLDKNLKSHLMEETDYFVEIMIEKNHQNLRTFQFFLQKFAFMYQNLKNTTKITSPIFTILKKQTFSECIKFKSGKAEETRQQYPLLHLLVETFVTKSIWNTELVTEALNEYQRLNQKNDAYTTLNKYKYWYQSTDEEMKTCFQKLCNELENIDINDYRSIIDTSLNLRLLDVLTAEDINQLQNKIKNLLSNITDREYSSFKHKAEMQLNTIDGTQSKEEKQRKEIYENFYKNIFKSIYQSSFDKEIQTWKTKNNITFQGDLAEYIKETASSKEIDQFREIVLSNKTNENDKEMLRKIKENLSENDYTSDIDYIKKKQIDMLKKNISNVT